MTIRHREGQKTVAHFFRWIKASARRARVFLGHQTKEMPAMLPAAKVMRMVASVVPAEDDKAGGAGQTSTIFHVKAGTCFADAFRINQYVENVEVDVGTTAGDEASKVTVGATGSASEGRCANSGV